MISQSPDLQFFVPGVPQPQGSTRPFRGRGSASGKIFTTSDNKKLRPWRDAVAWHAQEAFATAHQLGFMPGAPVSLVAEFFFARPKFHFGKRGLLASAPMHHVTKPDCSKLVRAIEDSLVDAGALRDDNQVALIAAGKYYADVRPPGALITVHMLGLDKPEPKSRRRSKDLPLLDAAKESALAEQISRGPG